MEKITSLSFDKINYAFEECINILFYMAGLCEEKRNPYIESDYLHVPIDDFKLSGYLNDNFLCKKIGYLVYIGMAYLYLPSDRIKNYYYGNIGFGTLYNEIKNRSNANDSSNSIPFWTLRLSNKTLAINLNKVNCLTSTRTPSINDNPDSFESIAQSQIELYKKKNSDYGSATDKLFQKHGFEYYQIMLEQKMQRIDSLIKKDNQHNFESLEDTLLDLSNYAILAVESLRKQKKSIDINKTSKYENICID